MVASYALGYITTKGLMTMRDKSDLKNVRKTVLMTEETANDIEREAKERGMKANAVMNERLRHGKSDKTPSAMAQFQNYANIAVNMMRQYSEDDAKRLEREAHLLWTF